MFGEGGRGVRYKVVQMRMHTQKSNFLELSALDAQLVISIGYFLGGGGGDR